MIIWPIQNHSQKSPLILKWQLADISRKQITLPKKKFKEGGDEELSSPIFDCTTAMSDTQ